jgi:hypothetical protein
MWEVIRSFWLAKRQSWIHFCDYSQNGFPWEKKEFLPTDKREGMMGEPAE